ncbi:NAD-dependent malic enzyme, partial [Kribbella sp. NPDC058693]
MPTPSPGYSITARLEAPASPHTTAGLTSAIGAAGGALTALDVVESRADRVVVDVTCDAVDANHAAALEKAL